eukprot:CAMPEP_0114992628 /NCGR_PEP_ID=MMETSP0216-20121206/12053_1 /TAXON_ID=223996 /ORGANISM="Protocruzia adherens, Strain Boccale" /LENGTH=478 /DNA_ID=CAMNT_0002356127 /DNA_START=260 /DNA_END=1697 /DNA_ORIENTATION=-
MYKTRLKSKFSLKAIPTFEDMDLIPEIEECLQENQFLTPTPIQSRGIPTILSSDASFLVAQPGTGKTLSYILPMLNLLKLQEIRMDTKLTESKRPRAIIIVPNRELAEQVRSVIKLFAHDVRLTCSSLCGGVPYNFERSLLTKGVDVIVTTLQRLNFHRQRENLYFSNVDYFVFDEADTLVDNGYGEEINSLVDTFTEGYLGVRPKMVFISATASKALNRVLRVNFEPNQIARVVEKEAHMQLSNLEHDFIEVQAGSDRLPLCGDVSRHIVEDGSTIIFTNSVKASWAVEYYLNQEGMTATHFHGDIPPQKRAENFKKFKKREVNFLVTSDLGSRGLDCDFVKHVINFDFPRNVSDYLHRAGRTGRAGTKGFVTSYYTKKNYDAVSEMRASYKSGKPLEIGESAFAIRQKQDGDREEHLERRHNRMKKKNKLLTQREPLKQKRNSSRFNFRRTEAQQDKLALNERATYRRMKKSRGRK